MFHVEPARPEEIDQALQLAFLTRSTDTLGSTRLRNARIMLATGELDPAGIWVARDSKGLAGSLIATPLAGASALVWPPATRFDAPEAGAPLVLAMMEWLRSRQTRIAQAILEPAEMVQAGPLLEAGFKHVTQLEYLRHDLILPQGFTWPEQRLRIEWYKPQDPELFHQTLMTSYEGTLDCPELNGRRSLLEIIDGHRQQGAFRPDLWWLAFQGDTPIGVVLLTELQSEGWDLSYLGVVPAARRKGYGRELTARVLEAAQGAWIGQLLCAVDARNLPARQLYEKLGFSHVESREALLFFFD